MRTFLLFALVLGLLAAGCIQTPPPPGNNTTNITPGNNTSVIPPGYEVKDYCEKDGDCVRLNRCCDCGLGEYVNKYNQQPECPPGEPQCMCPIALSHGQCQSGRCVAAPGEANTTEPGNGTEIPNSGFCGTSTLGACSSDLDCISGGCSGQVCQSATEPGAITTCEYRECYNAQAYGVSCGCAAGKCRWR
ncbi:eight-cysteine-cluster domain-containing protein [Candidatus Micrarchaeota archaeon]|nr:eight-cysteine-cluster domain-containing protein [Candidatus Micrarchaeota archaeon]